MGIGFGQGLEQVTLALFTTLAPAGTVAFAVMALLLLFGGLAPQDRERVAHFLVLPLGVAVVGFIGSATHLGKPSNALYVLSGIGRSPLSNEVVASVAFFALAGLSWYASFSCRSWAQGLQKACMALACCAGVWQVFEIANAYSIRTISTWSMPMVQVNLAMGALMGGSVLAIAAFSFAGQRDRRRLFVALLVLALLASVVAAVSQGLQLASLQDMRNSTVRASDLAPWYACGIAVSAVLAIASVAVDGIALRLHREVRPLAASVSVAVMFCGVFVVRFAFYCLHMTVGL